MDLNSHYRLMDDHQREIRLWAEKRRLAKSLRRESRLRVRLGRVLISLGEALAGRVEPVPAVSSLGR